MNKDDLDRLTLIYLLEQALERSPAKESAAHPHIRKAAESLISEIKGLGRSGWRLADPSCLDTMTVEALHVVLDDLNNLISNEKEEFDAILERHQRE